MTKRGQYEAVGEGWRSRGSTLTCCTGCGAEMRTFPSKAKGAVYCSRACRFTNMSGKKNPNYRASQHVKTCQHCAGDFAARGAPSKKYPQKYCSKKCAYAARVKHRTAEERRAARREWSRARDAFERAINPHGRHTKEDWQRILAAAGHRCVRCGNDVDLTRDHKKPLSKGGGDEPENIQPLCGHCNKRKSAKEGPVPLRVLSIDLGLRSGYAVLEHGREARSGSHQMKTSTREFGKLAREFKEWCDMMIAKTRADIVIFASPFVGKFANPANMKVLFGFATLLEMACFDRKIKCYECSEPEARRAFLTGVPRKSKDIKLAVMAACRLRGWPCVDDHAADALCVASWGQECLEPDESHKTTPLFTTQAAQ